MDKLEFIKMKNFCLSKDTFNRVKVPPPEKKKIFENRPSDMRLISRNM